MCVQSSLLLVLCLTFRFKAERLQEFENKAPAESETPSVERNGCSNNNDLGLNALVQVKLIHTQRRNARMGEAEESSSAYPCKDWCESDHSQGKNQGRHCTPGDMAHLCGGCSFCPPSKPVDWKTICKDPHPMGRGHGWWTKRDGHPSCSGQYRDDGVTYCDGDETSISMDMTELGSNKQGCTCPNHTKMEH